MGRIALVVALVAAALAIGYMVGQGGGDSSTTIIQTTTERAKSAREALRESFGLPASPEDQCEEFGIPAEACSGD